MATITITLADAKVNAIANDLEYIFPRADGISDSAFIQQILREKLRSLRRAGRERRAAENVTVDDNEIS